ncbi:DMT family transporter [Candidatus Bathyarchaeota archaeon]|nr:MAG: DMT family transporter [Candidatus Bathyarchaeota archaeon]
MKMIGELAALGAAVCWAGSAVLYKKGLLSTKPISANIIRCLAVSVLQISFLMLLGKINLFAKLSTYTVVLACLSGIIGFFLGDTLYMFSLKLMGVARAVPLTCIYPLFNIFLAAIIQGEKVTFYIVIGAVAIFFGVWLLSGREENVKVDGEKGSLVKGVILALTTAILWSISILMIDIAVTVPENAGFDVAFAVNTLRVSAATIILLISIPITDRKMDFLRMKRKSLSSIVFGGFIAITLGWFLLTFSFSSIPQSRAVPISSASPLFSTLAGIFVLHEKVTFKVFLGSVVIMFGIFLVFMT